MLTLYIVGFAVAIVAIAAQISRNRDRAKLSAARAEYEEIQKKYHTADAREYCPHRLVEFGQTGVSGVVTMTTKWCRVCGKYLGPATLKTSIFGNKWT